MTETASLASAARAPARAQSPGEEIANAATHALGALLSIPALVLLVLAAARRGDARTIVSFAIFGASLLALFSASALYHALSSTRARRALRIADHASIYLLIAGTYTAYSLGILGGTAGWVLFGVEWAIAAAGIAIQAFSVDRFGILATLGYVVMGWLIAPVMGDIRAAMPPLSFWLLAGGGIAYTLGVVFYAVKKVPYFHTVWHIFVLAGAACHVASVIAAA